MSPLGDLQGNDVADTAGFTAVYTEIKDLYFPSLYNCTNLDVLAGDLRVVTSSLLGVTS